jgi:hypothetical protein
MDKKLVKIKRGYHGSYDEYQYGDRVFVVARTRYSNLIFERPNLNEGQEIYKQPAGDYLPFIKKFREFLHQQNLNNG